jgi:hypothetical protein
MFRQLLAVQWKATRVAVLLATLIGFMIPITSVESISNLTGYAAEAGNVVFQMQSFGVGYAMLAAGTGLVFAVLAWSQDHRGRHVYALSLPVLRSRYALMRLASGALFLLLPTLGVLAGSLIGLSIVHVPAGLHGYPVALTLRFFLASAVAYAVFFAISASTQRTAGIVLGSIAAVLLVAFVLAATIQYDLISQVGSLLFNTPGLLAVFTGRWMLVDV